MYSYGAGHQSSSFPMVVFHKEEDASANIPRKHRNKEAQYEPVLTHNKEHRWKYNRDIA